MHLLMVIFQYHCLIIRVDELLDSFPCNVTRSVPVPGNLRGNISEYSLQIKRKDDIC